MGIESVGTRVRIRGGSLDGVGGILERQGADQSLVVAVELLHRSQFELKVLTSNWFPSFCSRYGLSRLRKPTILRTLRQEMGFCQCYLRFLIEPRD